MKFKTYLNRFHSWQLNPTNYKYPGKKHRCDCCGEEHEGNFCPLCGQKATHGPITWNSVWTGVMGLWGLHSRSLPYTAWQLLFRPGHLIRDYITGKRQVSFPPIKMVVLLGVIIYLLGQWLSPKDYTHEIGKITSTGTLYYVSYVCNWLKVHEQWLALITFSLFILPTWIIFRHAPLLKRHTLPQGFFIQVFMANQMLIIEFIMLLLSLFFVPFKTINIAIVFIYLYIDYKQLFGYNWWGTVWRMLMMLVIFIIIMLMFEGLSGLFFNKEIDEATILLLIVLGCIIWLMIYCTDIINRKTWRERGKWKA